MRSKKLCRRSRWSVTDIKVLLKAAWVSKCCSGITHNNEINYHITQKGEPFKGHDVSLDSLSDLIVKLAL